MSKFCMGCMEQYDDHLFTCPHCGYEEGTKSNQALHIEPGNILNGRYIIGRSLGFGGFGVTYIGWDALLEHKVAIKEYLPSEFATRMPGVTQVTVYNGDKSEQYHDGLGQFVNEAKRLARLNNIDGIVRIYDSFEENNTAYIVMEYLEGETLAMRLEREKTIDPDEAIDMLLPVIDSLQLVHENGILHRDLAPDNLFITKDGTLKVIDFGAARFATTSHSRSLTVIIKPGYSAEEQYRSRADQGSYTDVYSIGATLYKMITGITPPDALERYAMAEGGQKDMLEPISKYCEKISKSKENAILNSMNIQAKDRTATMAALAKDLRSTTAVVRVLGKIKRLPTYKWPLWAKLTAAAALLFVLVFGALYITGVIGFESNLQTEISIPADMTRVPSVVNNTTEQADQRMTEAILNYTIIGKEYSSLVPADYVLTQDVDGGVIVMKNSNVNITISGGAEMTILPDVTNYEAEQAVLLLEENGFVVEKQYEFSSVIEAGFVVSQSVEGGREVEVGSQIILSISKGVDPEIDQAVVEIQVPDLVGKTYNEILQIAEKQGFKVAVSSKEYSNQYAKDKIMQQDPAAGETILSGSTVTVKVSLGNEKVKIPDVQFQTKEKATSTLEKIGLKVSVSYEQSDSVASGLVIRQSPAANTAVEPGSTVRIVVSKGAAPFQMPNVVGMTEAKAKETLTQKGLKVSVNYEYAESKEAGTVLKQSVAAGNDITKGSNVTITVSIGQKPVTVPNVVGQDSESAQNTLKSSGFAVSVNRVYDENVAEGKVISQNPTAGSSQQKGTNVVLTVSLGKDSVQSIRIISKPSKTSYYVGDTLNTAGLKLKATYKSGKTQEISSGFTCSPTTLKDEGTQTITVTYQNVQTSFTVNVVLKKPNSITISSSSSVLEYSEIDADRCTIKAVLDPGDGNVSWECDNPSVAKISANGTTATVTAVSSGTATITATYTLNGVSISDQCMITVQKAASTLSITNLSYPRRGSVNDFYFHADISSNYELVKITVTGKATSNALGISVSDTPDPLYYQDGIYTTGAAESNAVTQYLIDQYRSLYNLYVAAAKLLGADSSVTMTITATVHDSSGASKTITIVYVLEE